MSATYSSQVVPGRPGSSGRPRALRHEHEGHNGNGTPGVGVNCLEPSEESARPLGSGGSPPMGQGLWGHRPNGLYSIRVLPVIIGSIERVASARDCGSRERPDGKILEGSVAGKSALSSRCDVSHRVYRIQFVYTPSGRPSGPKITYAKSGVGLPMQDCPTY